MEHGIDYESEYTHDGEVPVSPEAIAKALCADEYYAIDVLSAEPHGGSIINKTPYVVRYEARPNTSPSQEYAWEVYDHKRNQTCALVFEQGVAERWALLLNGVTG